MAFTAPTTRATDFLVTAAVWNAEHVDNMNTAWPHLVVRKTADETDSTGVLQNDDVLLLALLANEVWQFKLNLLVVSAATTDFQCRFTFPSGSISGLGMSSNAGVTASQDLGATASPSATFSVATANTISNHVILEGVVSNGGSAGNLQLQWSGQTAVACVVKANSTLWAVKLA